MFKHKELHKEEEKTIGGYVLGNKKFIIIERQDYWVRYGIHQQTSESVAIKILDKDKIEAEEDIERVSLEIQNLKKLRHPNIIQLYEIIETPLQIYLIMEYASAGELFDYIQSNQRISEMEACKYFQQLIHGVQYIHEIRIVHRDLKPENLLLDEERNIKIVDFGLSNSYQPNELLKTPCGSFLYAAPELISGFSYAGPGIDIWSCGVILFAMICGYLPFEDQDTQELYKKIQKGSIDFPDFVSKEAIDLITKIINVNPSERYNFIQIQQHRWFNLRNPQPCKGIFVDKDFIQPDETIINYMEEYFDIDPAISRKMVINNRHNNISTIYYLLCQKKKRKPGLFQNIQSLSSRSSIAEKDIKLKLIIEQKSTGSLGHPLSMSLSNNEHDPSEKRCSLTDRIPIINSLITKVTQPRISSVSIKGEPQKISFFPSSERFNKKFSEKSNQKYQVQNSKSSAESSLPSPLKHTSMNLSYYGGPENIEQQPNQHLGSINLSMIILESPDKIREKLIKIIQQQNLIYSFVTFYEAECRNNFIVFRLGVFKLKNLNIYTLKGRQLKGDFNVYDKTISTILALFL